MQNLLSKNGIIGHNTIADVLNDSIYEVIRIKDAQPIFFREHLLRMERSCQLLSRRGFHHAQIKRWVMALIWRADIVNHNIRIDILNDQLYIRPIPSHYPSKTQYLEGVDTKIMDYERPLPGAKVSNQSLVEIAQEIRTRENVFEVLLCDRSLRLTEGARSNLFFIKNDRLYTAPESLVLKGVTRDVIMTHAPATVIEQAVKKQDISTFDACFLTGTSIDALPVRRIDEVCFETMSHPLYLKCSALFESVDSIKKI